MAAQKNAFGFTLIELLVVLAVIATLLTIAVPRYLSSVERSREAMLRQNLAVLRDTLDKYYGDKGRYPAALDDLLTSRYLRRVPLDPITDSDATWVTIPPAQADLGGIYDVKSGAPGIALDGTQFKSW